MRATAISLMLLVSALKAPAELRLDLRVISSRPDTVSGETVLVALTGPLMPGWSARLEGRDVTAFFKPAAGSGEFLALLTGLKPGKNVLEVTVDREATRIEIVDHPLVGPIFSGSHQQPFICQTEADGLGPATDAQCSAPTITQYYYKSTDEPPPPFSTDKASALGPGFKPYDPSSPVPMDVAKTMTTDRQTVPFIVRRETGVINRAIYDIEFLYQPGQALPSPWKRSNTGWNGRLVYLVGGGAGAGYIQGNLGDSVGSSRTGFLARGYAVASATLSNFGVTANDRVGAETVSMVKEHFIKQYGPAVHVIGWGGSGGAMEEHLIVQNYPGLLDGIITYLSYPDEVTSMQSATDCQLLHRAFDKSSLSWDDERKSAVTGFATWKTCDGWGVAQKRWKVQDPQGPCPENVPKAGIYDRDTNPNGTRCDFYSTWINILGKDPRTGHAYRPLDNVGVQYGLIAFNDGLIDAEHFLELNERIGGFDDDGAFVAARSEAPLQALRNAYERGLVFSASGGAASVPIMDWRQYADDLANQHDSVRSFIARERLRKANGTADNQVILLAPRWSVSDLFTFGHVGGFEALYQDQAGDLVDDMDRWLNAIDADKGKEAISVKVARDKPGDLADGCWTIDGRRIVETAAYTGSGKCAGLYPAYGDPRIAAGGPLSDDILKCFLKPVDARDYNPTLTGSQLERLKRIFPLGVCDYTKPGVGQAPTRSTWQVF